MQPKTNDAHAAIINDKIIVNTSAGDGFIRFIMWDIQGGIRFHKWVFGHYYYYYYEKKEDY